MWLLAGGLVSYQIGLNIGLFPAQKLGSPRANDDRKKEKRERKQALVIEALVFIIVASEVTYCDFCFTLLSTQPDPGLLHLIPHEGTNSRRQGLLWAILEAGHLIDLNTQTNIFKKKEKEKATIIMQQSSSADFLFSSHKFGNVLSPFSHLLMKWISRSLILKQLEKTSCGF